MKDFEALIKQCMDEVETAGIVPGNISAWKINRRAKKRWGLCKKMPDGTYEIQIAAVLLENEKVSEEAAKTTMVHEILHTCEGCVGHNGRWKEYAHIMNEKYGYNIKRTTSNAEKGLDEITTIKRRPVKYVIVCTGCGQVIKKSRQCKFTRYYRNYKCGICGARAFRRIV